jgi:hypothetical protein
LISDNVSYTATAVKFIIHLTPRSGAGSAWLISSATTVAKAKVFHQLDEYSFFYFDDIGRQPVVKYN